jgi:hypothetical protein
VPIKQNSLIFLIALTLHYVMARSIIWPLSIGLRQKKLKRHGCIKKAYLWAPSKKNEESSMTHKLNSPREWLLEKAQHWNTDTLYKALSGLAYRLDGQSIRDLFHSEMDSDGYFDKKTKPNADGFDAESWGSHRWHT